MLNISGGFPSNLVPCARVGALLPFLFLAGCLGGGDSQSRDPVVVENPVVYVKRPLLFDEDNGTLIGDNQADPGEFRPGARLFLKDRASPDAPARDITSSMFSGATFLDDDGRLRYDVKDLSVSHDGSRVLFAMRAPEIEDADDDEQPTWNIWEYDAGARNLRRIIESEVTAEAGQDIAPAYLPDGRIVFSSTRQRVSRAILLDEGKPQYPALDEEREVPAFVLHVMDAEGDNIEQITFNQSHDLDPLVTDDGTIVFSRWDNAGQTRGNGFNLYRVNPDGTGLSLLFGRHSHDSVSDDLSVEYLRPQTTDSARLLAQLRPAESDDFGAIAVEIDVEDYVEAGIRVDGSPGSGQTPLVSGLSLGEKISLRGNYSSVAPLLDGTGRYLVSWSPCRLRLENGDDIVNCTQERIDSGDYGAAAPVYGLWLLDRASGTQRPIEPPAEGQQIDEAVLMTDRPMPTFIPESQYSGEPATLADEGLGLLHIRSVYDVDGVDTSPAGIRQTADPGIVAPDDLPVRFLRIEKPVSIPDEEVLDFDNTAFGRSRAQSMREILGYVPVEPDGSVRVAVPANVAFAISVVDNHGRRIGPRHQNWLNVRPGETLECKGCHNPASSTPHGRADAGPDPVNTGAPTTGREFPNTAPSLFADMGETMAQTWARISGQTRRLGPDAVYVDEWTDPANATLDAGTAFSLSYADLETPAPIRPECADDWRAACRSVINYEQHIHPLWGLERTDVDSDGDSIDYTCTGCHSDTDADEVTRVPEAQLDLADGPSADEPDHFKSYRELLFNDNEQQLMGDQLVDVQVESGEFLRDEDGELILDADDNPIPILVNVNVPASMSVNGARASGDFFDLFDDGGSHAGFLTPAELRLLAEWLDIGGQYYNNPFDAPAD